MSIRILALFAVAAMVCPAEDRHQSGLKAFRDIASVLTSPRCVNCHVPGDSPFQGDDGRAHNMMVVRGADGKGGPAVRCAGCHQDSNVSAPHAPPGVPGWRMPAADVRMAWAGLSTAQLCKSLKDPVTNGKRSQTELLEHVSSDKIVLWGWAPGPGRTLPLLSHAEFVEAFKTWAAAGAPCPE